MNRALVPRARNSALKDVFVSAPVFRAVRFSWDLETNRIQLVFSAGVVDLQIGEYLALLTRAGRRKAIEDWRQFHAEKGDSKQLRSKHELWIDGQALTLAIRGVRESHDVVSGFVFKVSDLDSIALSGKNVEHFDRLALLGSMITEYAHELTQPVYSIKNYVHACKLDLDRSNLYYATANLEKVGTAINAAVELVQELRQFGQAASDRLEDFHIKDALEDALHLLRFEQPDRLEISDSLSTDDFFVHANRVKLTQVFVNLLRNSIDAKTEDDRFFIQVDAQLCGDFLKLIFQDNGIGMSPGVNAFNSFVSTKEEGLGLGLSVCAKIIHEHQGFIWEESFDTSGTRICIELPIAK